MKVLCFGIAKEITKRDSLMINDHSLNTVSDLKTWISDQFPEFKNINACMIAVNQTYALDHEQINDHDEIAIIPPVAGG